MEVLSEVLTAMRYNRMRIILTGFSIGWGIFLLIVMLGSGNGVLHGITNGFVTSTENVITVTPNRTSVAYGNSQRGRLITLSDDDCKEMKEALGENVRLMFPQLDTVVRVTFGKEHFTAPINGFHPGYLILRNQRICEGRDINAADVEGKRKVCVLTKAASDVLFRNGSAVGQTVRIYNVVFTVVGVAQPMHAADLQKVVYAPFTTVRALYFRDDRVKRLNMVLDGLETHEANRAFVDKIRTWFTKNKQVAPRDLKAVSVTDDFYMYIEVLNILNTLKTFVWIVGLATLIAGIVGVSNIMLITVRERVRELGVRRAMGASSLSIIRLVLIEAVIITLTFGYIGMMLGIGLTELADMKATATLGPDNALFYDPTVSFSTVMAANGILLLCGLIAGYLPAKKAASIKLVDALAGNG